MAINVSPNTWMPSTPLPGNTIPQASSRGATLGNAGAAAVAGAASGGWAGAAIGAGASLAGSLFSNKGNKRATQAQTQANQSAEVLAREQMAEDKRRYDEQQVLMKAQWDAQEARREPWRRALAQRFGIPFPSAATAASIAPGISQAPPGWDPGAPTGRSKLMPGQTLGTMAGLLPQGQIEAPKLTLGDLGAWNRWGSPQQGE